ncbi:MAG: hypothetical protein HDR01_01125 [Lachnospiraceae bacterium]|nr:hypothetical protein [Lachnospiraceae bacterium]
MIRIVFIGALGLICSLCGLIMRNRLSQVGIVILGLWFLLAILDEIRICHTIKNTDNPQVNEAFDQMFGEEQEMKKLLDEAAKRIVKGEKKDEK